MALLDSVWVASFRFSEWERELDPRSGRVLWEQTSVARVMQADPFVGRPAEELLAEGFVRAGRDTTAYYVPDAEVLLSDAFLNAYCFRAEEGAPGEIGLAFWPLRRNRPWHAVEGVLWLDRGTAALKRLEFGYTNVPTAGEAAPTGGTLEFERLTNGAWVVGRWRLLMPRVAILNGSPTEDVARVRERGGEVLDATLDRTTQRLSSGGASLDGHLLREGQPVSGAVVYISGTERVDTTDVSGTFRLDAVPPGHWRVSWLAPGDMLASRVQPVEIQMTGRDTTLVLEELKTARDVRDVCPDFRRNRDTRAVQGVARSRMGIPLADEVVRLEDRTGRVVETYTDAAGRFDFCDVRPGSRVSIHRPDGAAVRYLAMRAGDVAKVDLRVSDDPASVALGDGIQSAGGSTEPSPDSGGGPAGPGRIVGTVVQALDGRPVEAALVEVVGAATQVLTNGSGRFFLPEVEPTLLTLRATFVGSDPIEDTVRVRPGELVQVRLAIGPVSLEPILVTARATGALAAVRWRAATSSFGVFVTAQELEAKSPRWMSDALRDVPGVRVIPQGTGRLGQLELRQCAPMVYLDAIPLTHIMNRRSASALGEAYEAINLVHPSSVEIIEVYRGASELPAEFGGSSGQCGAIVIWTKRGG